MRICFISILLLFLATSSFCQVLIRGTVRSIEDKKGIDGVNIMLQETLNGAISSFVITDKNGNYQINYGGSRDSVIISASGFNIRKQTKTIESKSQIQDFDIKFESISLKEVKIIPPKVRLIGDTVNYLVDGFIDKNDRTIGDVLKKMPGIDVKESGQVLYQNKPINKFYIEDMDLLQGRYGIATNNIEAKDVQSVQVLENHQPIKALKDKVLSEQAAINLKLKDSAKGTITANALLGAGASPFLWNSELAGMYFTKGRQNISTYKSNNSGDDVSRDLNLFYSRDADKMKEDGLLEVQSPSSPAISRKRYLFNRVHAVTLNNLWKLNKDYQLNANINYLNDREEKTSRARTEYYLPGDSLLKIEEQLSSKLRTNSADVEVQLNANKEKLYLNNLFKFAGAWNNERGNAITDDSVSQYLDKPEYDINNTFELVKNYDKTALNLSSFNGYSTLPHTLTVKPVLYNDLFDPSIHSESMRQEATLNRFMSNNKASVGFDHGTWKQNYEVNFRADLQHLNSELFSKSATSENKSLNNSIIPDSLKNDLQWNEFEWIFSPRYTYINNDWRISLSLPVNYTLLHIDNKIVNENNNKNYCFFNPSLHLQYKISVYWDLFANAYYSNILGGIRNGHTSYIMSSYRSLMRNNGDLYKTQNQNYTFNLNYKNPIRSLFGSVNLSYFNNKANLLYGYNYSGILQEQISYNTPNRTEGISANMNVSQTIDAIASTVRLGASYSTTSSSQISQREIVKFRGKNYSIAPAISTKIQSWSSLSYHFTFSEYLNRVKNDKSDFEPIRTISQRAKLNIFPVSGLTVNLEYEYFYNNAISSGNRSMSFGDIGVKYKWKKMEFLLNYTNVFNSKEYISVTYNDISSYYYAYELRPAEVMFKVRFKIK